MREMFQHQTHLISKDTRAFSILRLVVPRLLRRLAPHGQSVSASLWRRTVYPKPVPYHVLNAGKVGIKISCFFFYVGVRPKLQTTRFLSDALISADDDHRRRLIGRQASQLSQEFMTIGPGYFQI